MISTVTSTTVTTIAAIGSGVLGVAAVILLIILLSTKELSSAADKRRYKILSRVLTVGIAPLLLVFSVILVMKALDVL